MYNSGIVAVIKSNGRILREDKDLVYLPFNSEYSILLKNLETRKSLIKITIDGQDVLDNNSLILNPNTETELKGFMKGTQVRNKFKFIKKSKEISDYRGDRIDDGIVRIEYWFEQFKIYSQPNIWNNSNTYYYYPGSYTPYQTYTCNCSINNNSSITNTPVPEEGITVKGSSINQNYNYSDIGILEEPSKVIILKIIGFKEEIKKIIEKPLTIQSKKICSICGKKSKSYLKFCSNCGTFLD